MYNFDPSIFISIHAPPRGATVRPCANGNVLGFQFTPLREGRRTWSTMCCFAMHFNSRPSARGDAAMADISAIGKISIHAPPRGATFRRTADLSDADISIHAPPRGATNAVYRAYESAMISIHAPPRGATRLQPV